LNHFISCLFKIRFMILERPVWIVVIASVVLLTGCGSFSSSGGRIATAPSEPRNEGRPSARNDASPSGPWRADIPIGGFIQPPKGMTTEQAISEITSRSVLLLGSPYRLGGSSPREGFDCSGLVAHVMQDAFSLRFPRTTEEQAVVGISVPRNSLKPGDLVFFNTSGRSNSHVGVYLGQSRFVHAPTSRGVVRIESLTQDYWARRFEQARRLIAQN
jgi:cell wall-associated NlpC family hydrolase